MDTLILARERKIATLHAAFHTIEGDGLRFRSRIPSSIFEAIGPLSSLTIWSIEVATGRAKAPRRILTPDRKR